MLVQVDMLCSPLGPLPTLTLPSPLPPYIAHYPPSPLPSYTTPYPPTLTLNPSRPCSQQEAGTGRIKALIKALIKARIKALIKALIKARDAQTVQARQLLKRNLRTYLLLTRESPLRPPKMAAAVPRMGRLAAL